MYKYQIEGYFNGTNYFNNNYWDGSNKNLVTVIFPSNVVKEFLEDHIFLDNILNQVKVRVYFTSSHPIETYDMTKDFISDYYKKRYDLRNGPRNIKIIKIQKI